VGNVPDPSRFFVSGAAVFGFVFGGDTYTVNLSLPYARGGGASYIADSFPLTGTYGFFDQAAGVWRLLLSENAEPLLFTASTPTDYPWEVTTWIPSAGVVGTLTQAHFVQWDNSGVIAPNPWGIAGIPTTCLVPFGVTNGRPLYRSVFSGPQWEGGASYVDGRWLISGDGSWESDLTDAVYPWEYTGNFTNAAPYEGYLTTFSGLTRNPAANQQKWTVERNTVALTVENGMTTGSITVGGVQIGFGATAFVGWYGPSSIPSAPFSATWQTVALAFNTAAEQSHAVNHSMSFGAVIAIPYQCADRDSVYLYFVNP